METDDQNDASVVASQFEVVCPKCKTPVLLVDGSSLAGVLFDDFEHLDSAYCARVFSDTGWCRPLLTERAASQMNA